MDLVSPIKDILTGLWNCAANHSAYICHLEDNLTSLGEEKGKLDAIFNDVKQKVEQEEQHYKIRTNEVQYWLERVDLMKKGADELLQKGNEEIQKKCLGGCCPRNCSTSYRLGKEVIQKIKDVKELVNEGRLFSVFAERRPLPPVDKMPEKKTVGMESKLSEVWRCIEDPRVGVIGLYGIGGVGKTTLLTKLNNKFDDTSLDFEVVIWVTVSKEVKMLEIQEIIRRKLEIPEEIWKEKVDENGRATEIHKSLSSKKFVLLLDDLWEKIDLPKLGVPDSSEGKGCKIILTSRSEDVCRRMGSRDCGSFEITCLSQEEALHLFREIVTEDVLKSHHEIPKLAEIVAQECKGLPLALITIGSAMANSRKPEEWHHAIETLKTNPSKLQGVQDSLFSKLRYSYDSLSGDAIKNCFLYCSIFPEDHEINKHELINLWIAEGFLDNSGTLDNVRYEGEYIIRRLICSCLLERGVEEPENYVKMHDVLRDLALWLAPQQENKILVFENDGLIKKQRITTWKETVRITLWGHLINNCAETLICPHLLSFVARDTCLETFPGVFFESMPALKVLDLQGNIFLRKLPEVRNLTNMQYLNLSNTDVETLPIEVKNFKQLQILLLDGTSRLGIIPEGVISSLSSLQVFSRLSTSSRHLYLKEFWETGFLEEVKLLDTMEEISLTLFTRDAVDKLKSSLKLQSCVKRLTLAYEELLSLDISSGSFQNLSDLCVKGCSVKNLTCLRHAPQLRFLFAYGCEFLEEIIAYDFSSSEIEENLNFFQNLKLLYLHYLPNLKSICRRVMRFPSLERIYVRGCYNLRNLPFKSALDGNATFSASILGSLRWWNKLEWEDEATKHDLGSKFLAGLEYGLHYSYETKASRHTLLGYRFFPTNKQIINFLETKMRNRNIDFAAISEVDDMCKYEPMGLQAFLIPTGSSTGPEDQTWYFFNPIPNAPNIRRTTKHGCWKVIGKSIVIYNGEGEKIGEKRILVYYFGHGPQSSRRPWVIHEYHSVNELAFQDRFVLCYMKHHLDE